MRGLPERQNAISAAASVLARQLPATAIIAETTSGQTARNIASLRPAVPIVIATNRPRVYSQLAIVWGGKSYLLDDMEVATQHVIHQLRSAGHVVVGDTLVVVSGSQPGLVGGTDKLEIKVVD